MQSFRRFLLDRLVLRPTRHAIEVLDKERVILETRSGGIECFVYPGVRSHPPELLVLKFPGTAGRAERSSPFPLAGAADDSFGYQCDGEVWTWNPPGYGSSSGRATLEIIASAAQQFASQVLARRLGPETRVLLCGNSLGCAAALLVASHCQLPGDRSGIVLRNPPPLVPVVTSIAARYPLGQLLAPVAASLCDSMNAAKTAACVKVPAVFLQSQRDTLVPPKMQHLVIDAYAGPTRVVELTGLDHDGVPEPEHLPLIQQSLDWLWDQTGD